MAVTPNSTFCLSDYDCIGFDLDNTILRYKLKNHIEMVYKHLSKFLVEERGFDPHYLYQPIGQNMDFLQKGLVLDYFKGNVLQLGIGGHIKKAAHGTRPLTQSAINALYGEDGVWELTANFAENPLHAWNGPVSQRIRACLDYFDMPAALSFARCVDSLDAQKGNGNPLESYGLHTDIVSGLVDMFNRDNFKLNTGGYFPDIKANPELYMHRCSPVVVNWLRELKKCKKMILITGSNSDFASFTAEYCMGENWKDLFDVMCFFAKKPAFFFEKRPFLSIKDFEECEAISGCSLKCGSYYSQGNWQDVVASMSKETGIAKPKCLYIGDNIIQDVYTPVKFTDCDAIAMAEEMNVAELDQDPSDKEVTQSKFWGSYFDLCNNKSSSLWGNFIERYSKICVPRLEVMAEKPLDFQYQSFNSQSSDSRSPVGYYPSPPLN